MCEVQGKLMARLDRELPADEASAVERHVERCEECRRSVRAYAQVSESFDAYCDAVMDAKGPRRVTRWVPVLAGAVVVTAVVLVAFARRHVEPPPVLDATVTTASVEAPSVPVLAPAPAEPVLRKMPVHRRQRLPRVEQYAAKGQPMDTAIEIAIPAEAMFPPGAVPSGVSLIADLRIAPDGSVRQVSLRQ